MDKNNIMLSEYTMFYNLSHDRKIDYFDVLLYGNHGYSGTECLIDKIKEEKNLYIIVDYRKYKVVERSSQYNKDIVRYVMNNYEMIEDIGDFRVYYKK